MAFQLLNSFDTIQEVDERFSEPLPGYVSNNLNPKFEIRDYQTEALNRFDYYINSYKKRIRPTQLLFQMATGSGKTLIKMPLLNTQKWLIKFGGQLTFLNKIYQWMNCNISCFFF